MRTTVDLPDELMHAAKMTATERGESLKELFARAIAHEVGRQPPRQGTRRVRLPLIRGASGPKVSVTNDDIESVLSAEDAERHSPR